MNEELIVAIPEFVEFAKMPRLSREVIITEKLDGTNGQVFISDSGEVIAGSRSKWIAPGKTDNYGFAAWVESHRDELLTLGPGRFFGEWWGCGIQRRYGLADKRFSLFNVDLENVPPCCHLVPVLYRGIFSESAALTALDNLAVHGSSAAPGFMNPEGIVIYHTAARIGFKKTILKDEQPKGAAA